MKVHYLQHVPFEGLGSIEHCLQSAKHRITSTRLYESIDFPDPSEFDLLIVMGGPMSVNDESTHSWLTQEKKFIRCAVAANKSVLGICLGAQLIASSMSAQVYRNDEKEIGWFPVKGTHASAESVFKFPHELNVFHWHGEKFELPEGAIKLAESEGCSNQDFQLGRNVIGLQFHLETTPESAMQIVSNCRDELISSRYVQSEEEILNVATTEFETINSTMDDLLTYLLEKA